MKMLRIGLIFAVLFVLSTSAYATEYSVTVIAGTGVSLDLAFVADGCAGICEGVALACACYLNMYTKKTYDFPHETSSQRVAVEYRGGACDGEVHWVSPVPGSLHDTLCFTCADGKSRVYDSECPSSQAMKLQVDDGEKDGGAGVDEVVAHKVVRTPKEMPGVD